MTHYRQFARSGTAGIAVAAALASVTPGNAQEAQPVPQDSTAAAPGDTIVVTGSRIRRDPLDQDAPIAFIGQEDMAKTGLNSVNDVLQRLPSSGGGLNGRFNNSGNSGNPPDGGGVGAGAAEIDLRFLGSRRVLVLVDGIRYVNGASASGVPGSTDLNSIPDSAIERIEVLQDGASAIYGSDAIAGVVNIITKKSQDGLRASAQVGGYEQGDGFTKNVQLSWGNGRGPTQIVVGGNYVKQGSVLASDRALSRFPAPYANTCVIANGGCSGFVPLGRFGVFGNDLTLRGPVIGRNPVYNPGDPDDPASDFKNFATEDRFNFAPYNYLQIPLERIGLFANLRQELNDKVNLSAKLIWNQRKSKNQAAPLPFGVGAEAGITPVLDGTVIDATNPYNPFGVTLDASNMQSILRRFVEGGPRQFHQKVETLYATATLDGSFDIGGREWYWDINGTYGRNKANQTMYGNIHSGRLRTALGPVANCTGACVPFNIFGGAGSITQPMIDYVTYVQRDSSRQTFWDASANLSGSLFELPGGPLGIAVGAEYRKLKGRFDPDPIVASGFSSDIPALPTRGSYDVWEAYAEVNAPLLADRPFFELLELSGAVRYSDYSTSGSTTTFKGSVNWKPVPDLRLRASYAQGFRAPSIGELYGTDSRFDETLSDPCSNDSTAARNFGNDATVKANCIASGVAADGSYAQPNPQISVLTSGNEDLKAESSRSWVLGGVFAPGFAPGLSAEVNYYSIRIKDAIQAGGVSALTLDRCLVQDEDAACDLVTRVNGTLTQIEGQLQNIAGIRTSGWDVNLGYRTPQNSWGRLNLTWNNSFLHNYDVIIPTSTGRIVVNREGTEQGSPTQGFPKWKSIGIIDWEGKSIGATLTGRYVSALRESDGNRMKARFYTDLQLRWFLPDNPEGFGFAVGVNNLFNTRAPGCTSCDLNNIDPSMHDVPGRYFYVRASFKM